MFSIERVELTNFRSYVGTHIFELPTKSGLYNLTGKNLLEPTLGSNGSGKSTLLDAIYWCLFGRTTRGLKASDVVSWGQKTAAVTVTLTVGDKRALVSRTQSPNGLTLTDGGATSGHPIDQDALEKYLRLTPVAFLYSVILPQFGDAFFDLAPSAKLTLFSDIMGLDYWLERSQAADKLARDLASEQGVLELAVSRNEGQQETIKGDLIALQEKEALFAVNQAKQVTWLEAELKAQTTNCNALTADITYCKNVLVGAEEKIAALAGKDLCPTCKQSVPNADLKALNQNKRDFEERLRKQQWQLKSLKERLPGLKSQITAEVERESAYSEMIAAKKQALKALRTALGTLQASITKLDEEHTAVSFWIGGFKRVRLFIVEEALQQLEIEVNNNLANLGLMKWRVAFDVERENKSGGITKGFIVLIYPPGAESPIRYESFSGGETQRLRLAGDLGLANLIMERAGLSNTLEAFDEPSKHLSQEGLLDLAECLCQRAQEQGKIIVLVDHQVVSFSGFAGTFTVLKDADGSRLD